MSKTLLDNAKNVNGVLIIPREEDVDTISPSKVNTLFECQAKWAYRYRDNLKIPPAATLSFGSSFDDAISTNLSQKIKTKRDLPVDDVVDAFITSWSIRKEETDFAKDEDPSAMQRQGIGLIKKYQEKIAVNIDPLEVQKEYEVSFKGVTWKLKGYADIKETNGAIRDTKTAKKSPAKKEGLYQIDPAYRFQTLCYSVAEKSLYGPLAGDLIFFDFGIKTKNARVVSVQAPPTTAGDLKFFQQITHRAVEQMNMILQDKLLVLPNRKSYLCSQKYCGYWSRCINDYGGEVKP